MGDGRGFLEMLAAGHLLLFFELRTRVFSLVCSPDGSSIDYAVPLFVHKSRRTLLQGIYKKGYGRLWTKVRSPAQCIEIIAVGGRKSLQVERLKGAGFCSTVLCRCSWW